MSEAATRADARRDLLDAVKAATEEIGIVQVVNHGVPQDLINDFNQRIGRLLSLPRVRKADLASLTGHPYRGWRHRDQAVDRRLLLPGPRRCALVKDSVENYLKVFDRPEQITAWREGRAYVADLAENSAGR
jgi:isopenicillin N synthase-like dioxygenase